MSVPRDFRWQDAPRPDPDTGAAPLAPTPAADDPGALIAEARAWNADRAKALRSGLVVDLATALAREMLRADDAVTVARDAVAGMRRVETERDRLARRVRAIVAIGRGARVPDELAGAVEPDGWTTR